MSNLISRQDAIDALKSLEFRQYMEFGEYIGEDIREVCLIRAEKAQDALQSLPSAQPETHEEHTETHACDCVSGVAAIIAAIEAVDEWDGGYNMQRANMIRDAIKALPSEQPQWIPVTDGEPCEDMECWFTVNDGDFLYVHHGSFTRRYGERRDKGFITSGGFAWWNTVSAWMPMDIPEPYKGEQG